MSTTRKPLLVQKFGGTSLADLRGFDASAKVITRYVDEYRVIVVLSAVKGVTDLLLAAIGEHVQLSRVTVDELAGFGFVQRMARASHPPQPARGDTASRMRRRASARDSTDSGVATTAAGPPILNLVNRASGTSVRTFSRAS